MVLGVKGAGCGAGSISVRLCAALGRVQRCSRDCRRRTLLLLLLLLPLLLLLLLPLLLLLLLLLQATRVTSWT